MECLYNGSVTKKTSIGPCYSLATAKILEHFAYYDLSMSSEATYIDYLEIRPCPHPPLC